MTTGIRIEQLHDVAIRVGITLALGLCLLPSAISQSMDAVPRYVVKVQKYGVDLNGVYVVTLNSDRLVELSTSYLRFSQKRSRSLSKEDYERVIALMQGPRFQDLEIVPPDPSVPTYQLHYTVVANVAFYWGGSSKTQLVAGHMNSHMRVFSELISLLGVEALRCPFMIEWKGKPSDMCVVQKELQRQIDASKGLKGSSSD